MRDIGLLVVSIILFLSMCIAVVGAEDHLCGLAPPSGGEPHACGEEPQEDNGTSVEDDEALLEAADDL